MNLEKFQELAPKTVNDLTVQISETEKKYLLIDTLDHIVEMGRRANLGHMAQGMLGEAGPELLLAGLEEDLSNFLEEATDAKWFIVVAAWMKGYELSSERLENHILVNKDFYRHVDSISGREPIVLVVGALADVLKRESCYGKPKYQGKLITDEQYQDLFYDAISIIDHALTELGLDPEVGYDKVIEKLHGVRYKNEDGSVGFTEEKALNRDQEAEKNVIDN